MSKSKRQGELAETAFLHRATELELRVSKPFGDCERYDFIVDNGEKRLRVQVKSTRAQQRDRLYQVGIGHTLYSYKFPRQQAAYLASEIDFLAVYIFPERSWYILPSGVLEGRKTLSLHAKEHPRAGVNEVYREAWHLLGRARVKTRASEHR